MGPLQPERHDHWVFGDTATVIPLLTFSWTPIRRYALVKGPASPDDPALRDYWIERTKRRAHTLPPSKRKLAGRKAYTCELCGETLLNDEELQVDPTMPRSEGETDTCDNLTLHHLYCHRQIHARRQP